MKRLSILLAVLASAAFLAVPVSAQDWAKAKLEKSPRHGEWVDLTNGTRTVHCFVVYPEVKNPAPVVIVIHEIFGLSDWAKDLTDELAAEGYIAIAPDLLSGQGANGAGTSAVPAGEVTRAVSGLPAAQVTGDLNAVADYAKTLPSANGKLAVAGFCWGGGQSFRFACNRPDLKAALVFYGPPPSDKSLLAKIKCPVYGFYAENDNRISSTIPATKESMKTAGKTYEPVIYDGAGHGFMRAGEAPATPGSDEAMQAANKKARDTSWDRVKSILGKL